MLEFNELCPRLLKTWMAAGKLPNFKRFFDESQVFLGTADVTEQANLEPWIQWYSLHTGLDYYQHQVFNLTDGPSAGHVDIWHALLDAGLSVGNFAGMNAPAFHGRNSFYLPDPWCMTQPPFPPELGAFQKFVAAKVQENSNLDRMVGPRDYVNFLTFLISHGVTWRTAALVASQLVSDVTTGKRKWRRAAIVDALGVDVFTHYWTRCQPDYASIFMNSTAHFQHAFFHTLADLDDSGSNTTRADPENPIFYGYARMDRIIGYLDQLLAPHGVITMLTTAISQQSNPEAGKVYYRFRDIKAFLRSAKVVPRAVLPVMSQQYSLEFEDEAAAQAAKQTLSGLTMNGHPLLEFGQSPAGHVFCGNGLRRAVPEDTMLEMKVGNETQTIPFASMFYTIPHTKSGMHHPESAIWIRTGSHRVHAEPRPIIDVFPTLLDYFGVDVPATDGQRRQGRSFLPALDIGHYQRA